MLRWLVCSLVSVAVLSPEGPGQDRTGANPLAKARDAWAGRWTGDEVVVILRPEGGRYAGSLEFDGESYPLAAERSTDRLEGSFKAGDEAYPFQARRDGEAMVLTSGGSDYRLARQPETKNPLASPNKGAAVPASAGPTRAAPLVTFKHPLGFQLQHPKKWRVESDEEGIALTPPDVEVDERGQPLEAVWISAEDATGAERTDPPEVIAFFDEAAQQLFPGMKRAQDPEALASLIGPGTVLQYSGKTPTELDGRAEVYLALHQGLCVYMLHVGRKDLVEARRPRIREIFSSFGWTKGAIDPELVGGWHWSDTVSSVSLGIEGSTDSISSTTYYDYEFLEDGRVAYRVATSVFGNVGGGSDGSLDSVSIFAAPDDGSVSHGRWFVDQGRLIVLWLGGGVETHEYRVFPHTGGRMALKLTVPGETKGQYFNAW